MDKDKIERRTFTELERLRSLDQEKMLRANDVVDSAEDPLSPLHDLFEWDDDTAAHKWRLEQARQLIKSVRVFIEPLNIRVRAYTSLEVDRETGSGFRSITEVMAHPELRQQLLATCLAELTSMESRYSHLKELSEVWDQVHLIKGKVEKKRKR